MFANKMIVIAIKKYKSRNELLFSCFDASTVIVFSFSTFAIISTWTVSVFRLCVTAATGILAGFTRRWHFLKTMFKNVTIYIVYNYDS